MEVFKNKIEEEELMLNLKQTQSLVVGDVIFRSCNDHQLTKNDLEQARLELGESEDKKHISLQKVKEKLSRDKDYCYRLDDEYLLRFLRYRKYDVERAYIMIRKLYTLRKEYPQLFDLPPNLESFLNSGLVSCLPYRNEEGNIIFWVDSDNWNLQEMSLFDTYKVAHAFADIITMNPSCQVNGIVGIWDLNGLSMAHISQYIYPSTIRMFIKLMQESYPWRIKRVIGVNCNKIIRTIFNAFRYLLKQKVADRVILLGSDLRELPQYVNPSILPKKYGGNIERSECSITRLVQENMAYLKYERSFGPITDS